jgi:formamidopyrimidine-DNA glycosylase
LPASREGDCEQADKAHAKPSAKPSGVSRWEEERVKSATITESVTKGLPALQSGAFMLSALRDAEAQHCAINFTRLAMPELPEVETTRLGLVPTLPGKIVSAVIVRETRLRHPLDPSLPEILKGRRLKSIERRAKYLLFHFEHGTLLGHLGMSGTLRLLPADTPAIKHDHVDIVFGDTLMRFNDPRRFGALVWVTGEVDAHPLLAHLGPEPLEARFDADYLYRATRARSIAIKLAIMDAKLVVGVGNIYASESLYRAQIRPQKSARRLTRAQCERLVEAIRATLRDALAAGGSTLRDFFKSDGSPGYFQQQYFVYDRAGQPCRRCEDTIRHLTQGQRSTYYCPTCQRG